jgi:hypothetical protein
VTPRSIQLAAAALEKVDPVAELANRIIDAGISENELTTALQDAAIGEPLKIELQNKYRDLTANGWTINRHGKRWKRRP